MEKDNFSLEVSTPVKVNVGSFFKIEASFTYQGDGELAFAHGDPVIHSNIFDEEGKEIDKGYVNVDPLMMTIFEHGHSITVEDDFILDQPGKYELHSEAVLYLADDLNEVDTSSTVELSSEPVIIEATN